MIRNPIVDGGRAAGAIVRVTLRRPTELFGPVETRDATGSAIQIVQLGCSNIDCLTGPRGVVVGIG